MKKIKYKNQSNTQVKKVLIVFLILLVFVLILLFYLLSIASNKNEVQLNYNNLETIEDVLKYYQCEYISEKNSDIEGYSVDIRLKFRYNLYNEDDTSNEDFFNNVIKDIAKVLYFSNYRMIDEEKNIEIRVICEEKRVSKIIINNMEDYFIYMDSQNSLKKYEEIKKVNFSINSEILTNLISKNWNKDINLGTRDSIFNSYYIYFDEGIKVRYIDSKVYNIVFTSKYKEKVVNDIIPGTDLKAVKAKLGEPAFKDEKLDVIGYKSDLVYVFFSENEISVYRVLEENSDDFFELADEFLNDKLSLLEFMNKLTYMWPDYSDYTYSTDTVFISYPLKGIDIKINYDNTSGIVLYNNLNESMDNIKNYIKNTEFVARLKLDNVYEAEKRRFENEYNLLDNCEKYYEDLDEEKKQLIRESNLFGIYPEEDADKYIMGIKFISKNNENPNREISDNIGTYLWLNDEIFIFSKPEKGIYYFNAITGDLGSLLQGTEEFEIKEYKNGILKYDDSEVRIEY